MKKENQAGYTLVEIVVVIVIIGIIAAIVVPNLRRSMMNANEAAAISAMRVISQGQNIKLYATGEFVSLGQLRAESLIDERFGGLSSGATEASTSTYEYKISFITMPSGEKNYVLSSKPTSTNVLTRTGQRRFGMNKSAAMVYDATNFFTHYETLSDLDGSQPVGDN